MTMWLIVVAFVQYDMLCVRLCMSSNFDISEVKKVIKTNVCLSFETPPPPHHVCEAHSLCYSSSNSMGFPQGLRLETSIISIFHELIFGSCMPFSLQLSCNT